MESNMRFYLRKGRYGYQSIGDYPNEDRRQHFQLLLDPKEPFLKGLKMLKVVIPRVKELVKKKPMKRPSKRKSKSKDLSTAK
jgi:hypothetical protein